MKRRCCTPPIFCRWHCSAASGLMQSTSAARFFEIVEQYCRVEVAETLTTLHAVMGTPGIRRQLGVRPDQALLQLDEICYSRTCKPVLCCQTCYTDFFDFAMVRKLV